MTSVIGPGTTTVASDTRNAETISAGSVRGTGKSTR